jgi:lysozyme family protein
MTFDEAFATLISPSHEGGYVNNPADPGGETKFGISKRSYPHLNIKSLTREDVKPIYLHDFWLAAKCPLLPAPLRFPLFDFAVNSSVSEAVKKLQRRLGVSEDGVIGPITLGEISHWDPETLAIVFTLDRLNFMTDLHTWPAFGKGWARRIRLNILQVLGVKP